MFPPACGAGARPGPSDIADLLHDNKSGGPDIVSVNALASGGILTLRARFDPADFDPKTTRVAWIFDTDRNPATGSPGLLGAPGVGNYGSTGPIDTTAYRSRGRCSQRRNLRNGFLDRL